MSACASPAAEIAHRLDNDGFDTSADAIIEIIFEVLAEPDRDMLGAGAAELLAATPNRSAEYRRILARAVWRAMLERAR